jgi:hypothetical protein
MDGKRADIFGDDFDLSDFAPKPVTKAPVPKAAIRDASEAMNFPSRAAQVLSPAEQKPQRRRRTGRTVQFNIKVRAGVPERYAAIADAQGWVLGEMLEKALDALERELAHKSP